MNTSRKHESKVLDFEELKILVITSEDLPEFQRLLSRGLNTWESPPEWLLKVADDLHRSG